MKLLLIESTPGTAAELGDTLAADGHELVSCSGEHGEPCRGVGDHTACPLEGHVDLAIVARSPGAVHTLDEIGSICAARHRVPTVEVDPDNVADDLASVTVATAVATRGIEAAYAAAVRHQLPHLPALVDVRRTPDLIHVNVQVPASAGSAQSLAAVADRARHAVRTHDPFVKGIDVSVVCYPDPA